MKVSAFFLVAALVLGLQISAQPAQAQALNEPVTAHPDPESLFTSPDPKLHRNKQAALGIIKVLLEANQWDRASEFLTERYIQHNPLATSGLDAVVHYFTEVAKREPKPIPEKMQTPVVAVQAEGDYVTVFFVRELQDPNDPAKTYTTTWFDTWRFVDGKADEHWDPATLPEPPAPIGNPEDRAAIEQLMWDYVRAVDTLDADAYAAVFTPDGAFNQVKGRDALRQMVVDIKKEQDKRRAEGELTGSMHHFMANQTIEFVDRNHARVRYYWQTVFAGQSLENPPQMAAAGRGIDEVVRINGKWLIQSRNVAPDY